MKKFLSLIMAVVMLFSIGSVAAFAEETYSVTFEDCPYDIAPYRTDYIGQYIGYHYGIDYWFTITNKDGTTTDIKGFPYSVDVKAGDSLEFTVSIADYVEPASLRMMAFPTDENVADIYDNFTGAPLEKYSLKKSIGDTYGVIPTQDMTVCLSEYHLYNKCFLYNFPVSKYYEAKRVQYVPTAEKVEDKYVDFEWGNTKVIYEKETVYVMVSIPLDDPATEYHYDTYQVYYTTGYGGDDFVTTYLKKPASEKEGTEAVDLRVAHYETDTDWVDIYAVPNADPTMEFKVVNTVTYTLPMLKEFFADFSLENLDSIDLGSLDLGPMVEFVIRLLTMIVKLLNGFGLEIDISSLLG